MSVTYPDLTNDFPDVESDERYLYQDMTIDDVPYIVQYEKLLNALKAAADGASDVSSYQDEWNAFVAFKETDEYIEHVEPSYVTAKKFQTLEDKGISSQRFSKRQKQQWIISEIQPAENEQAVDDVWFRVDEITETGLVNATPFYKGEDGEYHEFAVSSKISFSTQNDINNITSGNTITNPDAVINNQALKQYTVNHDSEFNKYKDNIQAELTSVKNNISTNTSAIATNKSNIATNASAIATNKSNIATNTSNITANKNSIATMQSSINTMNTQIKSLQTSLQSNATSLSGTYRTGVISGGEQQTHTISFTSTFNKIPTVLASTGSGEFDVIIGTITKGGFTFDVKSYQPGDEYASWVEITWNATADTV